MIKNFAIFLRENKKEIKENFRVIFIILGTLVFLSAMVNNIPIVDATLNMGLTASISQILALIAIKNQKLKNKVEKLKNLYNLIGRRP